MKGHANLSSPMGFVGNGGGAPHLIANFVANDFDVNALRTNALLQKDEWILLDDAVIGVARQRLAGIADLRARNLVHNLGGLGVLTSEWENVSSMTEADVDMGGETPGREDTVGFDTQGVPVPIIHKGYRLNIRRLMASRRSGQSIDTIQAVEASRKVALKLEDILFNGYSIKNDGYTVYGYTNYPYRLRTNIGTAWDATNPTPYEDVLHMVETAADAGFYGPFYLYVPSNYWAALQEDYDDYKDGTHIDRILRIREVAEVKVSDVIAETEVVLVQMSPDVVDLAMGQDISNVEWNSLGGLVQHMKVMGAMVPRLKYAEYEGDAGGEVTGIVHAFEASASSTTTA